MGETQNLRHNRVEKYDPLTGRFVRDIKTTDIVNVFGKGSPAAANTVAWDQTTVTTDANTILFPYIFSAHATTAGQVVMYADGSTIASLLVDGTNQESIITNCNCPITRIGPSSTITLTWLNATATADTYCAWVVAKREPIISKVEDDA